MSNIMTPDSRIGHVTDLCDLYNIKLDTVMGGPAFGMDPLKWISTVHGVFLAINQLQDHCWEPGDYKLTQSDVLRIFSYCAPEYRTVCLSPAALTSTTAWDSAVYAVALHEMGHIVAPDGATNSGGDVNMLELRNECAAWEWALDAVREWTPIAHSLLRVGIMSRFLPHQQQIYTQTVVEPKWPTEDVDRSVALVARSERMLRA